MACPRLPRGLSTPTAARCRLCLAAACPSRIYVCYQQTDPLRAIDKTEQCFSLPLSRRLRHANVTNIKPASETHQSSALLAIVSSGLNDQIDDRTPQKVNELMSRNAGDLRSNENAPCALQVDGQQSQARQKQTKFDDASCGQAPFKRVDHRNQRNETPTLSTPKQRSAERYSPVLIVPR